MDPPTKVHPVAAERRRGLSPYSGSSGQSTFLPTHVLRSVGLSYYQSNHQDPNISHQGGEDDSEAEDFEVQASDFIILAARNEDEVSHIEVSNFYPIYQNL